MRANLNFYIKEFYRRKAYSAAKNVNPSLSIGISVMSNYLSFTNLCKAIAISSLLLASYSYADKLVVPGALADTEGWSSDGGTFGEGGGGDFRMQTIFASSNFQSYGTPLAISGIKYRPDASSLAGGDSAGWSINPILVGMTISLSTTAKLVDGLSSTFSENIGADQQTVVNGFVSVASANTLRPGGSKAFDIEITFAKAFVYDPALGNLLLDSRTFAGGNRARHTIDGISALGDSVSNVHTLFGRGGNAIADTNDTYGTIIEFSFAPVPESSSWVLLLIGICGVVATQRTFRRSREV